MVTTIDLNCLIVHKCGPDVGIDSGHHNLWEMITYHFFSIENHGILWYITQSSIFPGLNSTFSYYGILWASTWELMWSDPTKSYWDPRHNISMEISGIFCGKSLFSVEIYGIYYWNLWNYIGFNCGIFWPGFRRPWLLYSHWPLFQLFQHQIFVDVALLWIIVACDYLRMGWLGEF